MRATQCAVVLYIRYLFRANLPPTQCPASNFVRNDSTQLASRLHSVQRRYTARGYASAGLRECGPGTQCGLRLRATGYGYTVRATQPAGTQYAVHSTQCGVRVHSTRVPCRPAAVCYTVRVHSIGCTVGAMVLAMVLATVYCPAVHSRQYTVSA